MYGNTILWENSFLPRDTRSFLVLFFTPQHLDTDFRCQIVAVTQ